MRTLLLTLSFFFLHPSLHSQSVPYGDLFADAVRSLHDTSAVITYVEQPIGFDRHISDFVNGRGRIEGFTDLRKRTTASLVLTRSELRELDFQMHSSFNAWPDDLLANGRPLPSDSIPAFTRYLQDSAFWRQPSRQRVYRPYYLFSTAATTRRNSVAVFRVAAMLGPSSGMDYLFVYQRENGRWQRRLTLQAGAW